jgi:hypothetical protein
MLDHLRVSVGKFKEVLDDLIYTPSKSSIYARNLQEAIKVISHNKTLLMVGRDTICSFVVATVNTPNNITLLKFHHFTHFFL